MYKEPTAFCCFSNQCCCAFPLLCYAVSKFWGIVQGFGLPKHIIDSQVKSFLKLRAPFCLEPMFGLLFVAQVSMITWKADRSFFAARLKSNDVEALEERCRKSFGLARVGADVFFFLRKWGFTMQYYRRACVVLTSQCLGVCLSPLRSLNSIDPRNLRLDFLLQVVEHNMSKGTLSSSRTCSRCQISYVACLNDRANIFSTYFRTVCTVSPGLPQFHILMM